MSRHGVVVGLDGARRACVGPLIELLLADGGPVRVAFEASELLDAPEGTRVVLLHAARDAELLNRIRPIIAERQLRVLVWLEEGDRRELSLRARDFLDWMQESVEIPELEDAGSRSVTAEPLDWEAASDWLARAGVAEPRITAAKLELDPSKIAALGGPASPPMELDSSSGRSELREPVALSATLDERENADADPVALDNWWEALARVCEPRGAPANSALIVERPAAWPGFGPLAERLRTREQPGLHLVTGGAGSGVSTELAQLAARLSSDRCVISFDVRAHWEHATGTSGELAAVESWELTYLLGLAVVRVGRERWRVRWGQELRAFEAVVSGLLGTSVDGEQLASALGGVSAPDLRVSRAQTWDQPLGPALHERSSIELQPREIEELADVYSSRIEIELLLANTGQRLADAPALGISAIDFWSAAARRGALNMRAIMAKAAQRYPGNEVFARWRDVDSKRLVLRHARGELLPAVQKIITALARAAGRDVVLILDGLGRARRPHANRWIHETVRSLAPVSLAADVISTVPLAYTPAQSPSFQTHTRLDDAPVVDVHEPTERGPGIDWMRELIERRMSSIPLTRPPLPDEVSSQLCWASGGRPGLCMTLVRSLARQVASGSERAPAQLAASDIEQLRAELAAWIGADEHERLVEMLRSPVSELADEPSREFAVLDLVRRYPTPDGRHRYLPAPVLLKGLLAD